MITKEAYKKLEKKYPAFGKRTDKVKELIRDTLEPTDDIQYARSATISGVDGMILMTQTTLSAFWTTKMMIFIKLPTEQNFAFAQICKIEQKGKNVYVKAVADPDRPDDDYEENTFTLSNEKGATDVCEFLKMKSGVAIC